MDGPNSQIHKSASLLNLGYDYFECKKVIDDTIKLVVF